MKKNIILYSLTFITLVVACKTAYNPDIVISANNYLVVEGIINTGADSTIIKLSRTVNLNSKTSTVTETGAKVIIQGSDNTFFGLSTGPNGTYYALGLKFDNSKKYRVNIVTKDNKQYNSDYVGVKVTPPIDSVSYKFANNQLQLFVNSHDPANATRYYRFNYQETWEFHAKYRSVIYSDGKTLKFRDSSNQIYDCWANHTSNNILIGSTEQLSTDLLSELPLTTVNSTDEKIESRYSILVHEYALDKEGYTFWQKIKKNTEQLGGIFDAQPTTIQGNIHCVSNPAEPVFGYIGASTVTSKRIYITKSQLPPSWDMVYPYSCKIDTILPYLTGVFNVSKTVVPLGPQYCDCPAYIVGYFLSSPECADCTIRGVNKRPSYWPAN